MPNFAAEKKHAEQMETTDVIEALEILTPIVPLKILGERMGFDGNRLSMAKRRGIMNGKVYELPASRIEGLQEAISSIADELQSFYFPTGCVYALEIRDLPINKKYLAKVMKRSNSWLNNAITDRGYVVKGRVYNYYNKFSEQDLKDIVKAVHEIGKEISHINIRNDESLLSNIDFGSDEDLQLIEDEIALGML